MNHYSPDAWTIIFPAQFCCLACSFVFQYDSLWCLHKTLQQVSFHFYLPSKPFLGLPFTLFVTLVSMLWILVIFKDKHSPLTALEVQCNECDITDIYCQGAAISVTLFGLLDAYYGISILSSFALVAFAAIYKVTRCFSVLLL